MADQWKVVYDLSNGAIFNDLERPLTPVLWSRHCLTLNIPETVRHYRHSFNEILIGTNTRPTQQCHFEWPWVTLSDLAKYSMTWSVSRSVCDSWASCLRHRVVAVYRGSRPAYWLRRLAVGGLFDSIRYDADPTQVFPRRCVIDLTSRDTGRVLQRTNKFFFEGIMLGNSSRRPAVHACAFVR